MWRNQDVTNDALNNIIKNLLGNEVKHIIYHADAVLKPDSKPYNELYDIYLIETEVERDLKDHSIHWAGEPIKVPGYREWAVKK